MNFLISNFVFDFFSTEFVSFNLEIENTQFRTFNLEHLEHLELYHFILISNVKI